MKSQRLEWGIPKYIFVSTRCLWRPFWDVLQLRQNTIQDFAFWAEVDGCGAVGPFMRPAEIPPCPKSPVSVDSVFGCLQTNDAARGWGDLRTAHLLQPPTIQVKDPKTQQTWGQTPAFDADDISYVPPCVSSLLHPQHDPEGQNTLSVFQDNAFW